MAQTPVTKTLTDLPVYADTGYAGHLLYTDSNVEYRLPLNQIALLKDLRSTSTTMGVDLVSGSKKVFRVTDYGAVADYVRSSGTVGTNSTSAFQAAIAAAQAVNGVVYVPSAPQGYAYYINQTLYPIISSGSGLWRGASILGDGLYASSIYCDCGVNPGIHVLGTSGWPSNINISGISLYSHIKYTGIGIKEQGVCIYSVHDVGIYEFDTNLYISNGSAAGIFSEFINHERLWLKDGNTNIKFSRDGGDSSFHGINFNHCVLNNISGQTGINISSGCVVYNSDWKQLTLFGNSSVNWIVNNGSRNGFETLFFEGDGIITNNGSWYTGGTWRIQNSTGVWTDTSTVPFTTETYITPQTPTDSNFSSVGFTSISAPNVPSTSQTYRGMVRLRGNNSEGMGIIGYDSGTFERQGLALLSASAGDTFKDLVMRSLWHLNGITSFRPSFGLSYGSSGTAQLSINSTGRASGVMGRTTTGTITANASSQTITTTSFYFPESASPSLVSLKCMGPSNQLVWAGLYVGASSPIGGTTMVSLGVPVNVVGSGVTYTPPTALTVDSSGNISFTLTTSVDITYRINIIGLGVY
ncbi:tail fiber protein [Klebsiella phage vB_KvM-Eowyn]|uniref:Tail fiber protein n=1 Tax=Klebsiella phage vB_KvM-Eowyn TaxID=2762819 RepID=A0A7R8MJM1_9CAUD|nr:tail fiber protein [Klebsiella phage vB_KvM-Eowyn]CAD5236219.1 tail fiber protein [Klebsiella phage vB_KvM-Eowyn]